MAKTCKYIFVQLEQQPTIGVFEPQKWHQVVHDYYQEYILCTLDIQHCKIVNSHCYNCISLLSFIIGTEGRPTSSEQISALPNAAYERVNINPAYGELAATPNVTYEEIT